MGTWWGSSGTANHTHVCVYKTTDKLPRLCNQYLETSPSPTKGNPSASNTGDYCLNSHLVGSQAL